jgi:hypothetical protein
MITSGDVLAGRVSATEFHDIPQGPHRTTISIALGETIVNRNMSILMNLAQRPGYFDSVDRNNRNHHDLRESRIRFQEGRTKPVLSVPGGMLNASPRINSGAGGEVPCVVGYHF